MSLLTTKCKKKSIVVFTLSQPGNVCSETSDQHKIVNVMTVDHKSMWRRTQILTYIVSSEVDFILYKRLKKLIKHRPFNNLFLSALAAFTPVDLSDLKKRNTQDSKKS